MPFTDEELAAKLKAEEEAKEAQTADAEDNQVMQLDP